jgi:hypothetical protein
MYITRRSESMKTRTLLVIVGLLLLALLVGSCNGEEAQECPTAVPCPDCPDAEACPECPPAEACPTAEAAECPACPECPKGEGVESCPYGEEWAGSPHADAEAEAFVHWDEDDPAEVPASCAQCHSTPGYQDYVGADGSEVFVVDQAAPIGTTVMCGACHNDAAQMLDSSPIPFPSGITVTVEGPSARCAVCHQGRASGLTVDAAIEEAGLEDMDTVSEDLGFTNIHYFAAAATMYGTLAQGGYQYEGQTYDAKFDHVDEFNTCVECHDQHTLQLRTESCAECHSEADPKDIRMFGSLVDYDGDGDEEEGIYYEIETLQEMLMQGIQAYAVEVPGAAIVYDAGRHPYFFGDANENNALDEGEERYASWTGRLAKAAYNYQTSLKDPGAYAHGGKYIIELLYDSIADLNEALAEPIDLTAAHRVDHGHFAGSEEPFRHWDEDGMVEAGCATCHSADGLPFVLEHGVQIEQDLSNGFECETCHASLADFSVHSIESVTFPSGAEVTAADPAANLCLTCHQGRSSAATVDRAVGDVEPDAVMESGRFINIHYFAAGATLFGTEVKGAYEFEGKEYLGRFEHVEPFDTCVECHDVHRLSVQVEACGTCHPGVETAEDLVTIRMSDADFDGDGDSEEGMAGEIETLVEVLYGAMQSYAADTAGAAIHYDGGRYPYFFADANANNAVDEGEGAYATWTPTLLRAAYNYQVVAKDPGAFAHNGQYVLQFLYDSIEAVGGDVSAMTRP